MDSASESKPSTGGINGGLGIEVFGEDELVERLERGEPHFRACISIGNPRPLTRPARPGERLHPLIRSSFGKVLRLSFHDLEERVQLDAIGRPNWLGHGRTYGRLPSIRVARRILRFFEATRNGVDGYTIHCWAGISRSTATALALLYLVHGDEERAADELRRVRPQAMPNRRLVRCFDEILGSNLADPAERMHVERYGTMAAEIRAALDALVEDLDSAGEPDVIEEPDLVEYEPD